MKLDEAAKHLACIDLSNIMKRNVRNEVDRYSIDAASNCAMDRDVALDLELI